MSLSSDVELLPHTSFAESLGPWGLYGGSDPVFADGGFCTTLPGGQTNPWDAGLAFTGIPVEEGQNYVLTFTAKATPDTPVRVIVGEGGGAYRTTFEQASVPLTSELTTYTYPFTANLTFPADGAAPGQLAFHLGKSVPYEFCITDVSLRTTAAPPPPYEPETGPRVRVNQVGYVPEGPKRATLVTEATEALAWELHDAGDAVVASGTTTPEGTDGSTGLNVHVIDFSDVTTAGAGYTLVADGETSRPFDIDADLYQQLRQDALDYFYLARSGTPIDGAIVGDEYAREAGHVGVAPNQGDTEVPCIGPRDYYDGWTCDYTLDVTGGWYDAGDHGKYVVNGGISVAQLLGTYERTLTASTATPGALGDGTLDLPEHGNGVPDVLDEARWELELDAEDDRARPASTPGWCTTRSTTRAGPACRCSCGRPAGALAAPAVHGCDAQRRGGGRAGRPPVPRVRRRVRRLPAGDGAVDLGRGARAPGRLRPRRGGRRRWRPVRRLRVTDEFYWAAAELFLTTGEDAFEQYVLTSPQHTADVFTAGGFNWGSVAALGRSTWPRCRTTCPASTRSRRRSSPVPTSTSPARRRTRSARSTRRTPGTYDWGSSSSVTNNLVVLGVGVRPHRRRDVQPARCSRAWTTCWAATRSTSPT